MPVAVLPERIRSALGATATEAKLSSQTVKKQVTKHPDITPNHYSMVQRALERGRLYQAPEQHHVIVFHDAGTRYEAVLKTDRDTKSHVYLQSLHR